MARPKKILNMQHGHLTRKAQEEKAAQESLIIQDPSELDIMPRGLIDLKAKREWQRVTPTLKKMEIVGILDVTNLVGYCNAFSRYMEATGVLKKEGQLERKKGQTLTAQELKKIDMLVSIQHRWAQEMRRFEELCGLTINSRLKWAGTKTKEQEDTIESKFGAI